MVLQDQRRCRLCYELEAELLQARDTDATCTSRSHEYTSPSPSAIYDIGEENFSFVLYGVHTVAHSKNEITQVDGSAQRSFLYPIYSKNTTHHREQSPYKIGTSGMAKHPLVGWIGHTTGVTPEVMPLVFDTLFGCMRHPTKVISRILIKICYLY
jgi:hypothetical protein